MQHNIYLHTEVTKLIFKIMTSTKGTTSFFDWCKTLIIISENPLSLISISFIMN